MTFLRDSLHRSERPDIMGTRHVVSSGHYLASQAGFLVLEAGGNAVDAGVTTGLALNVLEPQMCCFAGVAPTILHFGGTGEVVTVDGLGTWPKAATCAFFNAHHPGPVPEGILQTVVPAAPDAWLTMLERYGTISFGDAAAAAIRFARDGFPLHAQMAERTAECRADFEHQRELSDIFLPGGRPPRAGEIFVQTDLAGTLQYLVDEERRAAARGREAGLQAVRDAFYRGDVAAAIVRFHEQNGGLMTMADMAGYRVTVAPPVHVRYRDIDVYACGPWCQGPMMLQQLNLAGGFDLEAMGHNTAAYVHCLTEAIKLSAADREGYYGDPRFVDVPMDVLLSDDYAQTRRQAIRMDEAWPGMPPPGEVGGGREPYRGLDASWPEGGDATRSTTADTTYLCVVDGDGNAFSSTPSDGVMRKSPVIPGTGLVPSGRGNQSRTDPGAPGLRRAGEAAPAHPQPRPRRPTGARGHALRDAGRRPSDPGHAPGVPQHARVRHEPPGGPGGAALHLGELPGLVLSPQLPSGPPGARGEDGHGGRHGSERPGPSDRLGAPHRLVAMGRVRHPRRHADGRSLRRRRQPPDLLRRRLVGGGPEADLMSAAPPPDPLADGGIVGFGRRLRSGRVRAAEATDAYLARIEALDPRLGAFEHVDPARARAQARALDDLRAAGTDLGPLMGVPVAVKDLFAVAGMPTTAGTNLDVADLIGAEGPFVRRLKRAGCVILGKTATVEFAMGGTGINQARGTPRNPWDAADHRIPGGSSSGSAVAAAAGLAAFAVGSDTGGSVRITAFSGAFGLKTTKGLWPTEGVFPLSRSLDTVGLLSASAADAAAAFAALENRPLAAAAPPDGVRLGLAGGFYFDDLHEDVATCVDAAVRELEAAGVRIVPVRVPGAAAYADEVLGIIAGDFLGDFGRERFLRDRSRMDPDVWNRLKAGLDMTADAWSRLAQRQRALRAGAGDLMAGLDGWMMPTVPTTAPTIADLETAPGSGRYADRMGRNTSVANMLGLCGATANVQALGSPLPVGLQILCRGGDEDRLLAVARMVEEVLGPPPRPDLGGFL